MIKPSKPIAAIPMPVILTKLLNSVAFGFFVIRNTRSASFINRFTLLG